MWNPVSLDYSFFFLSVDLDLDSVFFLWTSSSCYSSLGYKMRSGKKLEKSTEKMALGSQLECLKWLEVTWMTGAGDLLWRQLLHHPSLWDCDGWRTSSAGVVSGASVCGLQLGKIEVVRFLWWWLRWLKGWARQKLHRFLWLHLTNHMVLPLLYAIGQRSHRPTQNQRMCTWAPPFDGRSGTKFVATI